MKKVSYVSTRGNEQNKTFTEVILQGLARDKGLFIPNKIFSFKKKDLEGFINLSPLALYRSIAKKILTFFATPDFSEKEIEIIIRAAYNTKNFDTPKIAPLKELEKGLYILELWHGPTSAFKDMALQIMPLYFSEAAKKGNEKRKNMEMKPITYLILVATSGDTGKAALEGCKNKKHVKIIVFYPKDGVSDLQKKQMITQDGNNTFVFGVNGNFDDIQTEVKKVFSNTSFGMKLFKETNTILSSANSINWGRLLPQIIYYVKAYLDLVREKKIKNGNKIDIAVPTGNFGNILSAYYAKLMSIPIGKLICASNENKILADFIKTGVYDISHRSLIKTPSPSMDILLSSNLERLLYLVTNDPKKITKWMNDLKTKKKFQVDIKTKKLIQKHFYAATVNNNESLKTIRENYHKYKYLIDPHTAVAFRAAEKYKKEIKSKTPILITSTAHFAKFGIDVYKALQSIPYEKKQIKELKGLNETQILHKIQKLAPKEKIPKNLEILDRKKIRHRKNIKKGENSMKEVVMKVSQKLM